MIYKVYKNLNLDCYSIKELKTGLVVGYCDEAVILEATLVVQPSGRDKVRVTGQKNVHAYVKGGILSLDGFVSREGRSVCVTGNEEFNPENYERETRLYYNPKCNDFWVNYWCGWMVKSEWDCINLTKKGVYAYDIKSV